MPDLVERWTREQVLALPDDGNRYELVDGELLVSPSPRMLHQLAVQELFVAVRAHVRAHQLGVALASPADLDLREGQLVQPDLFVIGHAPGARPNEWSEVGVPILVVEVLSPSTARYDRILKRRLYQRTGVPEYWIVDLDARVMERWRPTDDRPEILTDTLTWNPEGSTAPMVLDLGELFREIHGS